MTSKKLGKKTARPTKPTGRNPVIAGRVPEPLHEKIKRAAKISGRSMSEELAFRAEESFRKEDALGGPGRREIAALMLASFNAAGGEAAAHDRDHFLRAVFAVAENLMVAAPGGPPNPEETGALVDLLAESLKGRLASRWAQRIGKGEQE